MPTYIPIKGFYSHQPSFGGLINTDFNPKDKVEWLFRLGIYGLNYRVLGLFLYIIAIKYLN